MLDAMVAPDTLTVVPETTTIRERLIVSPSSGRFIALPPEDFASEGEWVEPNAVLGEISSHGRKIPVRSPFRGWVMGMLALDNQPVKEGEALFWIWGA